MKTLDEYRAQLQKEESDLTRLKVIDENGYSPERGIIPIAEGLVERLRIIVQVLEENKRLQDIVDEWRHPCR